MKPFSDNLFNVYETKLNWIFTKSPNKYENLEPDILEALSTSINPRFSPISKCVIGFFMLFGSPTFFISLLSSSVLPTGEEELTMLGIFIHASKNSSSFCCVSSERLFTLSLIFSAFSKRITFSFSDADAISLPNFFCSARSFSDSNFKALLLSSRSFNLSKSISRSLFLKFSSIASIFVFKSWGSIIY